MTQPNSAQAVSPAAAGLAGQPADQAGQYLTFMLGGEMFAIGILGIKEILEYASVTDVPMMPPHIRGVINLRGAVVPVVDLSVRFGREPGKVSKRTCIVIVEIRVGSSIQDVGLVVDAVNEVLDIHGSDIEPPPAFGARISTDFIAGMGRVNGKFVIVLDVHHVMTDDDLSTLVQVADAHSNTAASAEDAS